MMAIKKLQPADWARIWALAALDPALKNTLEQNPKKAIEEFNKHPDHGTNIAFDPNDPVDDYRMLDIEEYAGELLINNRPNPRDYLEDVWRGEKSYEVEDNMWSIPPEG